MRWFVIEGKKWEEDMQKSRCEFLKICRFVEGSKKASSVLYCLIINYC
jgi:hypothetical protein